MSKKFSRPEQTGMNAAAYVDEAKRLAKTLEARESAGSIPRARARVAVRYGVPGSLLYSLRYRPPKRIAADAFNKLVAAVEYQALEQIRLLNHGILQARSRNGGVDDGRVRAALALADKARKVLEGEEE